ncbi:putative endopeptidase [Filimonas lacunae]|uniref:Putative endopeptidase n=1 Tax=Filimonas lacunae TaxID=477680 RepID=A0A173MNT9_9BACT|nr:M13 family metallopeptidase [Filimonas lacunae]BAV09304.1 peptidase, M13 family [Filimonas lacunae]SIS70815.1 putative endopeptidase [Filimonas lacunae]
MMKKYIYALSAAGLLAAGLTACSNDKGKTEQHFLEVANIDSSVRPADNFFLYVNGSWIKKAEIPATETGVGSFTDLDKSTREHVKSILEEAAKGTYAKGSVEQLVGDFYAAGMDSATIEKRGYEPVKPLLQQVDKLTDAASIMAFEASMEKDGFGSFLPAYVGPDEKNSSVNTIAFFQGGLGLPDRDYYFKQDPATLKVVAAYKKLITDLFQLTGVDSVTAAKNTETVYGIEKQLAAVHRTNVELRDPQSNYHRFAVAQLQEQQPVIGWKNYLGQLGIKADSVNVGQPAYYTLVNSLLKTVPVEQWKVYLTAHLLQSTAGALSTPFVNASFAYTQALTGAKKIKPRWERMYRSVDGSLGEALGQLYVKKYFTEDAKKRMLELVNNLEKSFDNRIAHLDWMSDSTKQVAKDKLHGFLKKIGFPDKWKDYSKVDVSKDKYFENLVAAARNEHNFQVGQVGKPVDKTLWQMTPPTINAYYNPTINEIVFPAGILQFPFFDPNADDAINYGGIGMVIGHEMTHGFDDQGSQYDKDGNMKDWWNTQDKQKFQEKVKQVINQYNGFTVLDSVHVNGALTTGENMADIGGIAIAWDAFKMTKQGQDTTKIDGFTPAQRFFMSFAQIWRSKYKDETVLQRINTDPHSPAMWRVLGPLMNFTPFYETYNVKEGDKMYKPESERIKIW